MMTTHAPATDYVNAGNTDGRPHVTVLGTVVAEPTNGSLVPNTYEVPKGLFIHVPMNAEDFKREPTRRCNDAVWAILFILHLGIMVGAAATFIPQMTTKLGEDYAADAHNDDDDDDNRRSLQVRLRFLEDYNNDGGTGWSYQDANYQGFDSNTVSLDLGLSITVVAVSCVSGIVLATLALGFMILFAETLIRVGFIATILLALLGGAFFLGTGQLAGAIVSLMLFFFLMWYACKVWSRIPFAATNLVTATTIVRDNLGVAIYAYLSLFLAFGWAILWTSTTIACLFMIGDCHGDGSCSNDIDPFIVFLFFASYHWTFQVIANVVTVTVAGVSGTWWMVPVEGKKFCSRAVTDSYYRANTLAFGSICLGSLIVAIVSATKDIIRQMRESGDSMIACFAEFFLSCIERVIEYFNEWAFCFVGIHGYSFGEAGMEVMNLLKNRGWTSIIADDLTGRALLLVSICVALINGLVGILIGTTVSMGEGVPLIVPFLIALVTGFTLCSTLFSVVGSACKSVIVLFAEAPNEFQANHPELSNRMRDSWQQAWPMDFKY